MRGPTSAGTLAAGLRRIIKTSTTRAFNAKPINFQSRIEDNMRFIVNAGCKPFSYIKITKDNRTKYTLKPYTIMLLETFASSSIFK